MDLVEEYQKTTYKKQKTTTLNTAHLLQGENLTKEAASILSESQKDLYSSLSKFQKFYEKQKYSKTELNDVWEHPLIDSDLLVNQAIATHFVVSGKKACLDAFLKEAQMTDPAQIDILSTRFADLTRISSALEESNLYPALEWAIQNKIALQSQKSTFEFQLHKQIFISNIKSGDALQYAKLNFPQFAGFHDREIQRLMCAILYKDLSKSPYKDLVDPSIPAKLLLKFRQDFASLAGMSSGIFQSYLESPLLTATTVGTNAFPTIIKMAAIVKGKAGIEWSCKNELPVEIPLLDHQRFHSVFSCPVSKEQSTEINPPMLMLCGHVVCKECLNRLGKNGANTRFKCPYCPTESTISQAIKVYF